MAANRRIRIEELVCAALIAAGATTGHVIRADQDGPKPPKPFVTVKVLSDVSDGIIPERVDTINGTTNEPEMHAEDSRRATVSVQSFGEEAFCWIDGFRMKLLRRTVREAAAPLGLRVLGPPQDANFVVDTATERRAVITVEAAYTATDRDDKETLIELETVHVEKTDDLAWTEDFEV